MQLELAFGQYFATLAIVIIVAGIGYFWLGGSSGKRINSDLPTVVIPAGR
jgi:hypothetical protein